MILKTNMADGQNRYAYSQYNSNLQEPRRRGLKRNQKSILISHVLLAAYLLFNSYANGDPIAHDSKIIDLSHVFDNTTIYWVTEPTLKLNVTYNGTMPGKNYWYQKEEISAATHGGTHLDAPCHFAKGRWCVSDIPLANLVVPAVVVDISSQVNGNPDVSLSSTHLIEWEKIHGHIPDRSLLLIYTGWSGFWPDQLNYTGTANRDPSQLKFPSIHPEAATWLVTNRNVVGVGLDTMSLDIPNSVLKPGSHVALMENNIYGIENVNNLQLLPPTGATVFVMPMKLKGASGAPCRVFAQLPSGTSGASSCVIFGSSFTMVLAVVAGLLILARTIPEIDL